jgi:hypothetical protein
LPWTVNPFKLYQGLMQGITPHIERIKNEKPDLARKILGFKPAMTPMAMRRVARAGYPPL